MHRRRKNIVCWVTWRQRYGYTYGLILNCMSCVHVISVSGSLNQAAEPAGYTLGHSLLWFAKPILPFCLRMQLFTCFAPSHEGSLNIFCLNNTLAQISSLPSARWLTDRFHWVYAKLSSLGATYAVDKSCQLAIGRQVTLYKVYADATHAKEWWTEQLSGSYFALSTHMECGDKIYTCYPYYEAVFSFA